MPGSRGSNGGELESATEMDGVVGVARTGSAGGGDGEGVAGELRRLRFKISGRLGTPAAGEGPR